MVRLANKKIKSFFLDNHNKRIWSRRNLLRKLKYSVILKMRVQIIIKFSSQIINMRKSLACTPTLLVQSWAFVLFSNVRTYGTFINCDDIITK